MTNQYEKLMNDVFGDLSTLTTEKIQAFQREILREVFTLKSLIDSENPEKQQEAMARGMALKELLDAQKEGIRKKLGLTPEEIKAVAELITGYEKAAPKKVNNKKIINLAG